MIGTEIGNESEIENKRIKPLFTKSRIFFLVSVFIVMSIPLAYRS